MPKTIEITTGPSREELFDGLRLFADKKLTVSFLVLNKQNIPIHGSTVVLKQQPVSSVLKTVIQSIQAEDGSGHSWNLTFSVEVKELLRLGLTVDVTRVFSGKKEFTVKAYYSTRTRKGTVSFD